MSSTVSLIFSYHRRKGPRGRNKDILYVLVVYMIQGIYKKGQKLKKKESGVDK